VNSPIAINDKSRQYLLFAGMLLMLFLIARGQSNDAAFQVRSIPATEAKRLIDGGAVVVDVRGPVSYGERHIPGAISVPLATLQRAIPATLSQAIAKPVVVYCGDGVSIGPEGTDILNKAGFKKAVNLQHGIEGWADAGLPLVKAGSGS
jgi:rhodanese-related sulfurtransferase